MGMTLISLPTVFQLKQTKKHITMAQNATRSNRTVLVASLAMGYLLCTTEAFSSQSRVRPSSSLFVAEKSTYEVDTEVNGEDVNDGRFGHLLQAVGLHGQLKHASDLPSMRTITPNDVFCNRELKMSGIKAIGVRLFGFRVIGCNGTQTLTTFCSCCLFYPPSLIWITRW